MLPSTHRSQPACFNCKLVAVIPDAYFFDPKDHPKGTEKDEFLPGDSVEFHCTFRKDHDPDNEVMPCDICDQYEPKEGFEAKKDALVKALDRLNETVMLLFQGLQGLGDTLTKNSL